ncbi:MAG: CoA synthetase [Burkholderiales bacterium]|nr:MAG: CoA synthetase [Burkholderiales bacterium]
MPVESLEALAARIPDGAKLAIAKDDTGAAIAATRALLARGVRDLHLVCVPIAGLQADLLIGAGCVATVESSGVSLGEFGAAPRFNAAVRAGSVRVIDATCPAIYAGLQASQKGIPFMPLRGILETDLLARRDDWKVIENPFTAGDRIVAISAIRPDLALFHAVAADRFGNVFLGRDRDGLLMAHAARGALVTVERIVEGNLLEDEARSGSVLPAIYVSAIAEVPHGTWPIRVGDRHVDDANWLAHYAAQARTEAGFARLLAELTEAPGKPLEVPQQPRETAPA